MKPRSLSRILYTRLLLLFLAGTGITFAAFFILTYSTIRDSVHQALQYKMKWISRMAEPGNGDSGEPVFSTESKSKITAMLKDTLWVYNLNLELTDTLYPSPYEPRSMFILNWIIERESTGRLNLSDFSPDTLKQDDVFFHYAGLFALHGFPRKSIACVPMVDRENKITGYLVLSPFIKTSADGIFIPFQSRLLLFFLFVSVNLFAAWFLSRMMQKKLLEPVQNLKEPIRKIGAGDYEINLEPVGYLELDPLITTLNQMSERIRDQITKLKETHQFQEELIANVSHDIKTPLATIVAYLEYILDRTDTGLDEWTYTRLKVTLTEAQYLQKLIRDLTDLTRIENNQVELNHEIIWLPELLHELGHAFSQSCEEKGIEFSVVHSPETGEVETDSLRLIQILRNLFQNALRHTSPGGKIMMRASVKDGILTLELEDTGEGIDKADLPHIFNRFYKKSVSRTREKETGSGLGLFITQGWVTAMKGKIEVSSEKGSGTVFTIELPA